MKLIQALPRRMRFDARAASSVELCVADWVSGSRYRHETTVFAERGENPLLDVDIYRLMPVPRLSSVHLAWMINRQVNRRGFELIVTQQHVATAGRIVLLNPRTPVILQTHNFVDPPVTGPDADRLNRATVNALQKLAGITLISEATRKRFEEEWPQVSIPRVVISNGFDFSAWRPETGKKKRIVVVGRARDDKGLLEAAQGIKTFLASAPDWQASFIISKIDEDRPYYEAVRQALTPVSGHCDLLLDIAFPRVKEITESAAISLVPSKWAEPFGRTALEGHAAGAALISSGTGGLREISGDAALYLPEVSGTAIAEALRRLASDPALRERIAAEGAARVRELFRLSPTPGASIPSICERLDDFHDEIVARARDRRA